MKIYLRNTQNAGEIFHQKMKWGRNIIEKLRDMAYRIRGSNTHLIVPEEDNRGNGGKEYFEYY